MRYVSLETSFHEQGLVALKPNRVPPNRRTTSDDVVLVRPEGGPRLTLDPEGGRLAADGAADCYSVGLTEMQVFLIFIVLQADSFKDSVRMLRSEARVFRDLWAKAIALHRHAHLGKPLCFSQANPLRFSRLGAGADRLKGRFSFGRRAILPTSGDAARRVQEASLLRQVKRGLEGL